MENDKRNPAAGGDRTLELGAGNTPVLANAATKSKNHGTARYPIIGYEPDGVPIIECTVTPGGTQVTFFCAHCRCRHYHGSCGDVSGKRGEGHRSAHCWRPNSPFARHGYVLKVKEAAS